jgi:uncharacterized CHY-type Zn-finger protein
MVDSLQVAAAVIVVFVIVLASEIVFACCRLYTWIRKQASGKDQTDVPPGRYRRGSVSHSWSEASVQNSTCNSTANHPPERIYTPADELLPNRGRPVEDSVHADHIELLNHHRQERRRSGTPAAHKLLFSSDYSKSLEQDWQSGQFACLHCKVSLSGQRYILHDEHPYCKKCYEDLFANMCDKCKTPITCDFKDLSYKDRHWHDKCFKCSGCMTSLIEQPFAYKNEQLYCAPCYESRFAARCTLCGNIFRAGMKKYEHKGRQWHAECFCCKVCQKLIGTNSFIPRGHDVICVPCYERQFGQHCTKCKGVITRGGIIYKNSPWHRDCFLCTHCHKALGRERYTSVEEQPYCVVCYGTLFAKKCYGCKKAITGVEVLEGIDDPKFIAFDSRQWHNNCFKCQKCATPLIGRGFMTDGSDIFCPDCCKEDN